MARAKLTARVVEEFPLERPNCGGDIWLVAFVAEPARMRKLLADLGEELELPMCLSHPCPPTDRGQRVRSARPCWPKYQWPP